MPEDVIQKLWEQTESFAGYAFCKAHSASFARLSFITAFLKTRHPGPFMAAVISNRGGFYPSYVYVEEARRLGMKILPPDVNKAEYNFKGDGVSIRAGLSFIKGLRETTSEKILQEQKKGLFQHLGEFLERCEISPNELEILSGCGALDSFGFNRREIIHEGSSMIKNNSKKGAFLFLKENETSSPTLPDLTLKEKVFSELQCTGMGLSASPAILLNRKKGDIDSRVLGKYSGQIVNIPGVRIFAKPVLGRKSPDLMEFISFIDEYGTFEGFLSTKKYKQLSSLFNNGHFFNIRGKVREDYGTWTIDIEGCEVL
jgi:DNA polymerase III alpha subunit